MNQKILEVLKVVVLFGVCMSLLSCAGPQKIMVEEFYQYALAPSTPGTQTKSNVSITVEVLKQTEIYKYPELFAFDIKAVPDVLPNLSFWSFGRPYQGKGWLYTFGPGNETLTACKVKIENNTGHILRMRDARIYLVVEGKDPIPAVTKMGDPRLILIDREKKQYLPKSAAERDDSFIHWITYLEQEYQRTRKKGLISFDYPVGIASQVVQQNERHYKLINAVDKEILPGFSSEGILLFPVIASFDTAKLMFYDITTKTDAAGNPIEKTQFEFQLNLEKGKVWFDSDSNQLRFGEPPSL